MIRLLLVAVGAWAAWRYRQQIKGYVNQLPQVQQKAGEVLHNALDASSAGRGQQQIRP